MTSDDPKPPDSGRVTRRLTAAGLVGAAALVLLVLGWLALRLVALLSPVVIPVAVDRLRRAGPRDGRPSPWSYSVRWLC